MSREICNECLARQKRDGVLSKAERERLVHRWRFFPGAAEHFRRDYRWWPKDGTAFHQRGIDFRTRIGEAGMSDPTFLATAASGVIVGIPAIALLVQTTGNDVAQILYAVTPLVVAIGVIIQVFAVRKANADTAEIKASSKEVHTLMDGQATLEKKNRQFEMKERAVILSILVKTAPEHQSALDDLVKRIDAFEAEIAEKAETVASLPSVVAKNGPAKPPIPEPT